MHGFVRAYPQECASTAAVGLGMGMDPGNSVQPRSLAPQPSISISGDLSSGTCQSPESVSIVANGGGPAGVAVPAVVVGVSAVSEPGAHDAGAVDGTPQLLDAHTHATVVAVSVAKLGSVQPASVAGAEVHGAEGPDGDGSVGEAHTAVVTLSPAVTAVGSVQAAAAAAGRGLEPMKDVSILLTCSSVP